MSEDTKVLTGLMERRALEAAFSELADTADAEVLSRRAREIARHGDAALPILLAMLDTNDPQLRGGLGQVAARLDRAAVVSALGNVARSPHRNDRTRLSALTILDRYLHEPVSDELLAGLQDPEVVARESLGELRREMAQNPYTILEYLTQLGEQPPDVPYLLLQALPALQPDPHLVTLLRLMAQDADPDAARKALDQLGRVRISDAARALVSLSATLPPELAALADRNLRKLRMSGVTPGDAAPTTEPWNDPVVTGRVLISAVDPMGAQMLWFISPAGDDGRCRLLSIVIQDARGIIGCTDLRNIPAAELPSHQPIGFVHYLAHEAGLRAAPLLEATFTTGAQVLREAVQWNWRGESPPPLQYRLVNPAIWLEDARADETTAYEEPRIGETPATDPAVLLEHPAFAGWGRRIGGRRSKAERRPAASEETAFKAALEHFGPEVRAGYARRLQAMGRWLALAGDAEAAALAVLAAIQIEALPPEDNPFVLHLVKAGFEPERAFYSTMGMRGRHKGEPPTEDRT